MQQAQPNMGQMGMGGNQDALQQAIMARQSGAAPVPQMNQTMQGSPQPSPVSGSAPMPIDGQPAQKAPNSEAELIVKALSQRLGMISKTEQAAPVGGGSSNYMR